MPKLKFPLISLFLVLSYECAHADRPCEAVPGNALQLYFVNGLVPVVLAGVNGNPAAMVLDTGSALTFVTPDLAKQAGLSLQPLPDGEEVEGIGGSPVPAYRTAVQQFILGNAVGSNLAIGVVSMVDRTASPENALAAADGTLGMDVLQNYDIDMDFPSQKLTLYTPGGCLPGWTAGATPISFSPDSSGRIHFWLALAGKRFKAMLDTGSGLSNMPRPLFIASGLSLEAGKPIKTVQSTIAGGYQMRNQIYRLDRTEIGGRETGQILLMVSMGPTQAELQSLKSTLDPYGGTGSTDTEQMALGEPYIREHRIFISTTTHTLYIASADIASATKP